MPRIEALTPEQEAMLPAIRDEWLAVGLSTEPADRAEAEAGVDQAYRSVGQEPPGIKVWLDSPFAGAIGSAMLSQVWDQVRRQIGDQIGDQVQDQVRRQVQDQIGDQVQDQVRRQIGDQIGDQVRRQVWDQVWEQVRDQVRRQIGDQIGDQVRRQVWDQVWEQVRDQVGEAAYGQHDAHWLAHFLALGRIGATGADRLGGLVRVARSAGWWWPMRDAVILTDRPAILRRDGQGRLHREDGPALLYRDGWGVYAWHGVRVPADLIETGWDTERIMSERNAEVRRCAIEKMGWDRFVTEAGLTRVGRAADDPGNPGQHLALYDVPEQVWDEPVRVLLCTNGSPERNGTRRRFGLTVPADISGPLEAAAWTYDLTAGEYAAAEVRR